MTVQARVEPCMHGLCRAQPVICNFSAARRIYLIYFRAALKAARPRYPRSGSKIIWKNMSIKSITARHISATLLLMPALLCSFPSLKAQELVVVSFEDECRNVMGESRRKDFNGDYCALIKVVLPEDKAAFEGDIVGDRAYKGGEYWIYLVSTYTKKFRVAYEGCEPVTITFADYGIERLRADGIYQLKFDNERLGYLRSSVQTKKGNYLSLSVTPASASLTIDGEPYVLETDGSISALLSIGSHSYEVSASGYATERGTVTIGQGSRTDMSLNLKSVMARLQLSCETSGAQFYVNDRLRGTGSWTGDLTAGSYYIEARKEGYHTASRQVTLAERETCPVAFPALTPITGALNVNYRPVGTEVWIDGKKVGDSPNIFNDIIVGQHSVELRSSGYEARKSSVTISEGQETRLEGSLSKQTTTVAATSSSGGSGSSSSGVLGTSGTHQSHEYVDLGLSVKWATCNVGASKPSDYGDYYAWGETSTKSSYNSNSCETWNKSIGDIKGTSRDVAHVKWGGSWRMPTRAEFEELLDSNNCTWTWITQGGHKGYKVTSKKNGNSIFLPAAGWRTGTSRYVRGNYGYYWSSTPYESSTQYAYNFSFHSSYRNPGWHYRDGGFTVRPVAEF